MPDGHSYVPRSMEHSMAQQLQSSLPAHLRQYVNPDRPTYIPAHIEKQLAQHMQGMSGSMKQYSGAFLHQRVKAGLNSLDNHTAVPINSQAPAPLPDQRRLGHSMPVGEQHNTRWAAITERAPSHADPAPPMYGNEQTPGQQIQPQMQTTAQPLQTAQPEQTTAAGHPAAYDFIMNPEQRSKPLKMPSIGNSSSTAMRALFAVGGLLVLVIVIAIFKSILGGGGVNAAPLITVAQDQQELVHLSANALNHHGLAASNQTFATTAQLVLTSDQSRLLTYLANNHKKVSVKQLNLGLSASVDSQLTNAAANSIYDQTFASIMQTKLQDYESALSHAYNLTSGAKGRALLTESYKNAQLLAKQFSSPAG